MNRIFDSARASKTSVVYTNCPACGAQRSLPVSWPQLMTWKFDGVTLKQSTCVVCGTTRTIAKIIDGRLIIVTGEART